MRFQFIQSISKIRRDEWNALWKTNYPFTSFEFLHALERSGSTTESSGWQPFHLVGYQDDNLSFVMPLYLKTHSYGEYVFDWAWADAYARTGLEYYPKLLNAIPFTPATGPRWAIASNIECDFQQISECLIEKSRELGLSSFHSLFPNSISRQFPKDKFIERKGTQFHWFNNHYSDFDDYLSHFSSRKRKNIRKERQKTSDFEINILSASERDLSDWEWFYQLYHRTYLKRSGRPGYLSQSFFSELASTLSDQLLLASAEYQGEKIAGAVYFKDDACLYGRYWGTSMDIDALHFETCYYQGIDYAIKNKIARFDPGAQGEHKIQRGFQAVTTCSYHWIAHKEFRPAIKQFCDQEKESNAHYTADARTYLPFKEGFECVPEDILIRKK